MNGNTPSPTRAALDTIGGILLSACVLYLMLYGREILSGTHYVDWSLVRTFALLGLLTLGISFFEQRKAQSS